MTEYIDEYGEVHQLDAKQYGREQKRLSEENIRREHEAADQRFAELTNGYDDQAFAELKQQAIAKLDPAIQPAYVNLDPRKSRTLKRLIVEILEAA